MDRICEHVENNETEVKSDFDLRYCARCVCLVDINYCRYGCKAIKENRWLKKHGLRNPELDYIKVREACRTGQVKRGD